jgi:hypothetical protein
MKLIKDIYYFLYFKFVRCSYCKWRKAVWSYMPGKENACEKCVPRGCSCNNEPTKEMMEKYNDDYIAFMDSEDAQNKENYFQPVDEKGRKYPCCEWHYIGKEGKG